MTRTLDAAAWGAELALGDAPGRIYVVEPLGPIEDDPNVTDKKTGHAAEAIAARLASLAELVRTGRAVIDD